MSKATDEIITSGDGSHTLISSKFDTSYHSMHGAITESTVVFIQSGLDYLYTRGYRQIQVFEMGFGTGLNALLAYIWAEKHQVKITYHTIEAYPVTNEMIACINYGHICNQDDMYQIMHLVEWEQSHHLSDYFTLLKKFGKLEESNNNDTYDVVFYDAFGPSTQAELWSEQIASKMFGLLRLNGVLVTFCAQGAFKRNLKAVGFKVEGLPGPPGKREMTRAHKGIFAKST